MRPVRNAKGVDPEMARLPKKGKPARSRDQTKDLEERRAIYMTRQNAAVALVVAVLAVGLGAACSEQNATFEPDGPLFGVMVSYVGQGFTFDGTTWSLNDQRCGQAGQGSANDGGTGQFANWNGPGQPYQAGQTYMVWILTANGATSATLKGGPFGAGVAMIRVGGTFKYASDYYSPTALAGVYAEYEGAVKGNVQLTVSHGCPPGTGGWCSPGFWRNASNGAWQTAGFADKAAGMATLFNGNVTTSYYATANANASLTIGTVLTDVGGQGGANKYGSADAPYGLNAFNAVGAFLTDQLVGGFDPSEVGVEGACQIDHHGNYKQ